MTNSPCFVILQDLGDSCYLRCRECKTEFWSDATGENCLVDYIDRTFGFCCPDVCKRVCQLFEMLDDKMRQGEYPRRWTNG